MRGPRAVLFDLDGTLVDSAPDIAAALNAALRASGRTPIDLTTVKAMVGAGARRLVERALGAEETPAGAAHVEACLAAFLAAYRQNPARLTTLYPNVREMLAELASADIRLGVVTNKPHDLTKAILEALDLASMFGAVCGCRPGVALKPAPDLLRSACADLGVEARDVVMVGDSAADVGAARAFGCPVVLLAHGYNSEPVAALGADGMAADFADLRRVLAAVTVALPGPTGGSGSVIWPARAKRRGRRLRRTPGRLT